MSEDYQYLFCWDIFGQPEDKKLYLQAIEEAGFKGEGFVLESGDVYWNCLKYGLLFERIKTKGRSPDLILEKSGGDTWKNYETIINAGSFASYYNILKTQAYEKEELLKKQNQVLSALLNQLHEKKYNLENQLAILNPLKIKIKDKKMKKCSTPKKSSKSPKTPKK